MIYRVDLALKNQTKPNKHIPVLEQDSPGDEHNQKYNIIPKSTSNKVISFLIGTETVNFQSTFQQNNQNCQQ